MTRQAKVCDIYEIIDAFAPFDTALEMDNVGLLVGAMDRPVDTVLTALDATPGVVREAQALGAQLLLTHHPVLFQPLRCLDEAEPEAALLSDMIRAGISMIAAHTNLDIAQGGVNDTLAAQVGWPVSSTDEIIRMGTFEAPRTLLSLQEGAAEALGTQVLRYGGVNRAVSRFAICSGSGSSEVAHAAKMGAEVFLTGEVKHDMALDAMARGMAVLAAGHRATEICAADVMAKHLQLAANAVKLRVRVFVSKIDPFS